MGIVVDENRARRTPCKCYMIDPTGPRDDPDNLLCFSEGIVGSLSDTQDRDFCTERDVHPPSERFARHIRKFKLWGAIADKCLGEKTEDEFLKCVRDEAGRAFRKRGVASQISGQVEVYPEVRVGDIGTLTESLMADNTAGFSHRIPTGMEIRVARVEPKFIGFHTGDVIEGENYFITPLTLEFRRKFRESGTRKFKAWFTTPTGFERFVDVEATDEGAARGLAEKQVPVGSEFRYVTEILPHTKGG